MFVDESAFDRRVSHRPYAWAPSGNRARRRDFFIRGKRYSILPALSLDGILALEVLDRPFTALTFNTFIEGVLDQMNPWPQRNSVIVMDNASIHKSEELRQMIENRCDEPIIVRQDTKTIFQGNATRLPPSLLTRP